jgi:hypothetical protein
MVRNFLALLAAAALAAACGGSEDPVGEAVFGTVYGRVSSPTDTTLENATVIASPYRSANCDGTAPITSVDTTNLNGDYRFVFGFLGSPFTGCIEVVVLPPSGSGLASDSMITGPLAFEPLPGDSAKLDIQLIP